MKPSDFHTVPRSNAGVRVPLLDSEGNDTGEWLLVYGPDSKVFTEAHSRMSRRFAELGKERGEVDEVTALDVLVDFRVALIGGWSFDEPFTAEAVRDLLRNAPGISNAVEFVANDRARFFGPGSNGSTSGPMSSENSAAAAAHSPPADSASPSASPPANSPTSSTTGASSAAAA